MRDLSSLDEYRFQYPQGWDGDDTNGAFMIPSPTDEQSLAIIASSGFGWDHVSVSRSNRCPNWPEMERVRRRFFRDDEAVMQYHAPLANYVDGSQHGNLYCLHLWRPHANNIPAPPKWMVGGMTVGEAELQMRQALQAAGRAEKWDAR